jgi:hypothetical protein
MSKEQRKNMYSEEDEDEDELPTTLKINSLTIFGELTSSDEEDEYEEEDARGIPAAVESAKQLRVLSVPALSPTLKTITSPKPPHKLSNTLRPLHQLSKTSIATTTVTATASPSPPTTTISSKSPLSPPRTSEIDFTTNENERNSSSLTLKSIATYQRDSVLLLPNAYDDNRIKQLNEWCQYLSELQELPEKYRRNLWRMDFERTSIQDATPRLCRIEHFICFHDQFYHFANGWLKSIITELMGEEVCLLKEKLNYKGKNGGAGYAPHCDGPSCAAYSESSKFITAMVALTPHTVDNGCLLVCKGRWYGNYGNGDDVNDVNDENGGKERVHLTAPLKNGDKKGSGRVGRLTPHFIRTLEVNNRFEYVPCPAGSVLLFDGWTPHRSSINTTNHSRNALFFIYNLKSDGGDQHDEYYKRFNSAN